MKKVISTLCSLALLSAPAAAFAESATAGVGVSADASVSATGVSAKAGVSATVEANAKSRADREIKRRTDNLNQLMTRVNAMSRVSDSAKASLQSSLSAQVSTLTALDTKIAADTDLATLKTDVQSITKNYRIYLLVIPQAHIAASVDRVGTIADEMLALGAKLETRISASTSTDVTALQNAYADMQAKITDAKTQSSAAVSATASLTPDNGDKTVAASNEAALKAARAQIQAATKDLQAARADIKTILTGLKVGGSVNASSTVTAQ